MPDGECVDRYFCHPTWRWRGMAEQVLFLVSEQETPFHIPLPCGRTGARIGTRILDGRLAKMIGDSDSKRSYHSTHCRQEAALLNFIISHPVAETMPPVRRVRSGA